MRIAHQIRAVGFGEIKRVVTVAMQTTVIAVAVVVATVEIRIVVIEVRSSTSSTTSSAITRLSFLRAEYRS